MGITLLFSDMIASHDSKLIKEACDSIINQKLDFKDLKAILDNEKIKEALNESEMETLKDSLSEVLRDTDDDFILTQNDADFKLKCFILKYGEIPKDICLKLNLNTIYIDIYEIIENKLYILANMPNIDNKKIRKNYCFVFWIWFIKCRIFFCRIEYIKILNVYDYVVFLCINSKII